MEALVLEHTRNARKEGVLSLLGASILLVGTILSILLFDEISVVGWCGIAGFGALSLLLLFAVAIPNLRSGGQFTLRIYTSRIVSESPVPLLAKSFDLLLSEIDHLEHDTRGDNDRWTIVARNGSRYEVTEQYRLPVKRVMRILQATEPPLRIVELTQWESPWSKRKKARRRKDGAQL